MQAQAISSGHADFVRRVARIASGRATGMRRRDVGTEEGFLLPDRRRGRRPVGASWLANALRPLSFPVALGPGLMSHGVTMVARAQRTGLTRLADRPDIEMPTRFVPGFPLSPFCARTSRLASGPRKAARSPGVAIGMLAFHNLVHLWPEQAARLLTDFWVRDVVTHAVAPSIPLRGISFAF